MTGRYSEELVEGGFAVEVADAPLLHAGLNVADLAHVLVLRERGVVPDAAARRLLGVLLDAVDTPVAEFGYDPGTGRSTTAGNAASWPASGTTPAGCTPAGHAARRCGSRCGCGCGGTRST